MRKIEYPWNGRYDRIHHYSNAGMKLLQNDTGELFDDAIDVFPTDHTYDETNIPVEPGGMEADNDFLET